MTAHNDEGAFVAPWSRPEDPAGPPEGRLRDGFKLPALPQLPSLPQARALPQRPSLPQARAPRPPASCRPGPDRTGPPRRAAPRRAAPPAHSHRPPPTPLGFRV